MNFSFNLFIILFSLSPNIFTQILLVNKEIPLKTTYESFFIDDLENIYLVDSDKNEIIKLSPDGKFLFSAGGYGWEEGLFDNPVSIWANPLEVLVADFNNNRIQKFDKNLIYNSKFETKNFDNSPIRLESPISIDVSSLGDLYVLDNKNKRIYKINGFSLIEKTFGGYSTGNIFLGNPTKIKVGNDQRIYVLDENSIKIFDQFTNSIASLDLGMNNVLDFCIYKNQIYFITSENVFRLDQDGINKLNLLENIESNFIEIEARKNFLYLLTEQNLIKLIEKE